MFGRIGIVSLALLAALAGGHAARAQAQPTAAAPPADDPDGAYWDAVHLALREYEAGNWAEARVAFDKAHQLRPSARTYRGLGLTAYELRDYVEAVRALRQALQDTRSPLTASQRDEISALVVQAERYVGRVILDPAPADLIVRVNGRPRALADDGSLPLSVGKHQLTLERPGHRSEVRDVDVRGGETITLAVGWLPLNVVAPVAPALPVAPAAPEPGPARERTAAPTGGAATRGPGPPPPDAGEAPTRLWTWVALGTGALLAGGAAALWVEGNDRLDGIVAACEPDGCTRTERDRRVEREKLELFEDGTRVALGLSVAALAAGVVLFLVEGADERGRSGEGLSLHVTPMGVQLGGAL